jgi:hypothetical protein
MKTRILAWACLGAGLWLAVGIGTDRPVRPDAAREMPRSGPGIRRPALSTAETSSLTCALAHEGEIGAAWELCDRLPPSRRRECALRISEIQAATDPLGAWRQASSLDDPELRRACQVAVLKRGSDARLPELADLASSLPEEAGREAVLCEIVSRWALQDPLALSAWPALSGMPAAVRDEAARRLVLNGDSLNRTPEVAGAWAESIEDPELRHTVVEAAAREWSADDPEAAIEFVRHSPRLDDSKRAAILSALTGQVPP